MKTPRLSRKLNYFTHAVPLCVVLLMAGLATRASAGLVGYWQFEEGTGTTTADASGYGFTGTLQSGSTVPTWQPGFAGAYSLEFNTANSATDGNISRVNVGNPLELQFTTGMTLAAWVYLDAANTSSGSIVSKVGASGLRGWRLGNDSASQAWELAIAPTPTSVLTYRAATGSVLPAVGTWTHVAGVYDGANQTMALYINGVQISGSLLSGTIPSVMNSPAVNVAIGGRANDFSQKWDGKLDEVRIYDNALTGDQIMALVPEPSALSIFGVSAVLFGLRRFVPARR
jgi:hypothetical protein